MVDRARLHPLHQVIHGFFLLESGFFLLESGFFLLGSGHLRGLKQERVGDARGIICGLSFGS